MLLITHRIKTSSEFMDRYLPEGPAGGFFLPEKLGMPLGSRLCIELVLGWLDERYYLYARVERVGVKWANCGCKQRGAIVRLEAHEAPVQAVMLETVRRSAEAVRKRSKDRQETRLEVHLFDEGQRTQDGQIQNLSATGVFVRAPRPLPTGCDVHLRIQDRAHQVMRHVRGKVVRVDFSDGLAGMGIEFHFSGRRERRQVSRMCRHLAAS